MLSISDENYEFGVNKAKKYKRCQLYLLLHDVGLREESVANRL
jgi:hypothetical protein